MENHVERKVFYYELDFQYLKDVNPDERSYVEIINEIRAMCNNQAEERFFARRQFNMSTNSSEEKKLVDDNKIGVFEFKNFSRVGSLCAFKFIRIRKDVFPELIQDNDLNKLEDIDGAGKSVVESTHIILDSI